MYPSKHEACVGAAVGAKDGVNVGRAVGAVGAAVTGAAVVGNPVGNAVGRAVGAAVVGASVGARVGGHVPHKIGHSAGIFGSRQFSGPKEAQMLPSVAPPHRTSDGAGVGAVVVVVGHSIYPTKHVVVEGTKGRQSASTVCWQGPELPPVHPVHCACAKPTRRSCELPDILWVQN